MKLTTNRLKQYMTANEFCDRMLPLKDKLFRLSRRMLINDADAEDAVQEVFYKLWLKSSELSSYQSIEGFAMVVARNLCLDKVKSKGYHQQELAEYHEPVDRRSPEKMAELKDEMLGINMIVSRLPAQQRMIFHLRDVEGMEFEEIEKIMNMKVNALRVSLSRARKTIREQLMQMHNYEYQGD